MINVAALTVSYVTTVAKNVVLLVDALNRQFQMKSLRGWFKMSNVQEEIFNVILDARDGDYVFQALILKAMKPQGW